MKTCQTNLKKSETQLNSLNNQNKHNNKPNKRNKRANKLEETNHKKIRQTVKEIKLVIRIIFAVAFFILGFNISMSAFFKKLPFFGYHTIVEILISIALAAFGYFILPKLLSQLQSWLENLINKTVSDIVTNFWDQQSKKIQDARREKQKQKAEEQKKQIECDEERSAVIDTSVLIDGRIIDVVKTGFFDNQIIVLQGVLDELQLVSDSKNTLKRKRGRRGLDIVKELKKLTKVIIIEETNGVKEVDKMLVTFAKKHNVKLITMDYNLNKVAKVSGVQVLNINDLANSLKTVLLPGEEVSIKIIEQGKERKQGVGYLKDGTMVVVENTKELVGETVKACVKKVIQSSAGRMVFCDLMES